VGRNGTERERASRRPLPPHPTPRLTWEEARSRARRLYPRSEIVDKFRELKNDALFKPNTDKVVAVVQIKGAYPHWFRTGRILEVRILSMGACVFPSPSLSVRLLRKIRGVLPSFCLLSRKMLSRPVNQVCNLIRAKQISYLVLGFYRPVDRVESHLWTNHTLRSI